ncbi:MAG: VPLPA-CTERM sorting domain-containing protein, partial [Gammaproteobacteria bacterium]
GAGRLFWADVSGVVPASSNGTGFAAFPSMPVRAVIVAVTPVPLPAAGWLLAAALGAFALKGRRKGVQP